MLLKNLKKTFCVLNYKEKMKFILLSFLTLIVTFFELISLGSVPIYISLIFDTSLINMYLKKVNLDNIFIFNDVEYFIYYSSFFLVSVFLLKNILISISYYCNLNFINNLRLRFGKIIYHNNIHSDYLNLINRSTSEIIRNHNEIYRFCGLIGHYQRLLLEIVLLIFLLIITFKLYFVVTILFFGLFSLFFIIYFTSVKQWVNNAGRKIQVYKRLELKILENTFSGIKEIKFNSKEFFFSKLFNDNYFKANRVILLQDLINKLPKISLEMLAIISITGISIFFYNSELSTVGKISNLSFLTVVAIRLIPAFTGISVATISIKYVEPSIDIIVRDMKSSSYYSNLVNKKSESYTKKIKEIKLENLTFNYGLKNERLLENINLSIVENDKIGIHGTSGTGKTTLINLLTGLIPPTKGNVYFNEINIHNKANIFYNKISYVTQDTFLFDDTIENNIIFYGNKIDNEKLNKIIKICKLNNFIDNSLLGLQQNIGEKGLRISGGQKQRIGIARALYKDFDILILDEATSALNKDYERSIITSLNENFKDKIIIIISHDKENLLNCNKIINIENNQINIKDN